MRLVAYLRPALEYKAEDTFDLNHEPQGVSERSVVDLRPAVRIHLNHTAQCVSEGSVVHLKPALQPLHRNYCD